MAELDDAYANATYIPGGMDYPDKWAGLAAEFRASHARSELDLTYGDHPRQRVDLFHPDGPAKGLMVFVHGGYWLRFDKSFWSHLAVGALARGWVVAMPSYRLAPEVRIGQITQDVEAGIGVVAARVDGPIRLAGHSAGGHLVGRMICDDRAPVWRDRVEQVVPISPVADLDPLRRTSMNAELRIEPADPESLTRHGRVDVRATVWVGADERPVFIEQAQGLAAHWGCDCVIDPGRHHFDVIEPLADPDSPLTRAILG
ncbi:alpha/beta hydrolase [Marivivens marinus]|uniref:alpha/beta hydrolase n=1 Tax=Marivivens marinus TaxID=3110173 RepID=UPI003B8462D9